MIFTVVYVPIGEYSALFIVVKYFNAILAIITMSIVAIITMYFSLLPNPT